ncbi:hypothetical protein [uncultured Shewanella sp.]|uniref:hypothetical protein n=1 Tax=uncultured Shewanella sp. TaxID=173975 RepID=UPI0026283BA0|nr:hypothetical protein [uncultured Shewanella sp.]
MSVYQTKITHKQQYQTSKTPLLTKKTPSKNVKETTKGPKHNISQLQLKPSNTGLPDHLKNGMEHLSGTKLDHVKMHFNLPKPAIVQPHAYTQDHNIHLSAGQEKHFPYQLKAINGTIEKERGAWKTKGASHTPPTINNTQVRVAPDNDATKDLLTPSNGFIWGHLIKAAWDGGNETSRLTLWNQARENAWTRVEQSAQQAINRDSVADGVYDINVETADDLWGTKILGGNGKQPSYNPKWLQTAKKIDINTARIHNARNALDTVVTSATMKILDGKKVLYASGKVEVGKPNNLTVLNVH